MISLRTAGWTWIYGESGVRSSSIRSQKFIENGKMILKDDKLILNKEGKLFADGIAAELFIDSV